MVASIIKCFCSIWSFKCENVIVLGDFNDEILNPLNLAYYVTYGTL